MDAGWVAVTTADAHHDLPPGTHRVGRDPASAVPVDAPLVSRHHADLVHRDGGWLLVDAGSRGGTWHDGARSESVAITGPVEVRLGDPASGPGLRLAPHPAAGPPDPRADPARSAPVIGPAPTGRPAPASGPSSPPPPGGPPGSEGGPLPSGTFTGRYHSPDHTTIGRDPANDIVVGGLLVSRHHAEVHRQADGRFELVDLQSRNGTYVNGRRIGRTTVGDGDLVAVGHTTFRVTYGILEEFVDTGSVTFEAQGLALADGAGRPLIDDVSLALPERSLCAVVGPSGSGKSTLLAALAGLRPAPTGRVLYGGRDLYAGYAELRNRIGFVPQDDILHRGLPLRRALEFSARLRFPADVTATERAERIDEVMEELGIAHRASSPVDRLSGGERKRTSVAIELLTRPSLLFLDEPASGLDPGLSRVLMRLLRELADDGRSIVVVTHELANLGLCDRVLILARGGVPAYVGPPGAAPARFGRDDLADVFGDLASAPDRDWRMPELTSPPGPARTAPVPEAPPVRQQSWPAQVRTLAARTVAVLAADRRNLALLAAQAPVLGLLMLAALPGGELGAPDPPEVRLVSTAGVVLFVILLGATWLGANNSIREIAGELPVLRRERSVGLSLSAYVTAKVLVLSALTVVQAVVLVAVATVGQGGPDDAVLLGWPIGELMVVVALAGVASMALGLLVSALAGTPERATTVLPMLLILQLVLSAGVILPEIGDEPGLRQLAVASSAQWGVAGAASTVDLNGLQEYDRRLRDLREVDAADPVAAVEDLTGEARPEGRWAHTPAAWLRAAGMLVLLTVLASVATTLALRRHDPGR